MKPTYTEVFGGTFVCPHCGATWIGTWHGPKKDMTCIKCDEYMYPDLRDNDAK